MDMRFCGWADLHMIVSSANCNNSVFYFGGCTKFGWHSVMSAWRF
jgi:hypothetical protein